MIANYLEYESLDAVPQPRRPPEQEDWSVDWADLDALAALPRDLRAPRRLTEADYRERLEDGKRCLGFFAAGELLAYNWVDVDEISFPVCRSALREDEAYLFSMVTSPALRGRGIAPFLRRETYRRLAAEGRVHLYSVTARRNRSSIRFKAKLGVRHLALYIEFRLFKKRLYSRCVKRYPDPPRLPLLTCTGASSA